MFDVPVAVMDFVVTVVAELHEVVGLGGAVVFPVDDVVGDAPLGFSSTADAPLVPSGNGGPELGTGVALAAQ